MTFDATELTYNDAGLIPAIAQDSKSGEILMMAWMNQEAVRQTLSSGQVTYWSRSRQELWRKGATSGNTQTLVDFRFDCDGDCLLLEVQQEGHACHTGRRSCFYRAVRDGEVVDLTRETDEGGSDDPPAES